jgi:hypothetical protein
MKLKSVFAGFLALALAAALVAGCANQVEPAKKVIGEVESAVTAAGADATKYIPDQVQAVTSQISDLKMKFDQKDYVGVIAAAPGVLAQAQGLAAAAATQKAKVIEALTGEWTSLAAALPVEVAALEGRIGELAKARKLPAGMDAAALDAAKTGLTDVTTLWGQAAAAQASGDIEQAVTLAKQVKEKADGLLAALGMNAG